MPAGVNQYDAENLTISKQKVYSFNTTEIYYKNIAFQRIAQIFNF